MLKHTSICLLSALLLAGCNQKTETQRNRTDMPEAVNVPLSVMHAAPAMGAYSNRFIRQELWNRPELSRRDRSLVTVASLISRNDTTELPYYLNVALDSGVTATELSETITHLAFYSGWPNATAAAVVASRIFAARNIDTTSLPGAEVESLPIDEQSEVKRSAMVYDNFGQVAPGVVKFTTEAVFRDLWLRPGLAPRDRSLITVSALVTAGQVAQVPFHLNRAMDNGLTRDQASEVLTQLAFVAGWPNVFSAMPVFKEVFMSRKAG